METQEKKYTKIARKKLLWKKVGLNEGNPILISQSEGEKKVTDIKVA